LEIEAPHVLTVNVQQTPNPDAQFPSALPPLLVHSDAEKQVPNTFTDPEDFPVHWSLGNVTTEKSEKTFPFLSDSISTPEVAVEQARKKTSPIFSKSTILM
jgi:hypothetical protein